MSALHVELDALLAAAEELHTAADLAHDTPASVASILIAGIVHNLRNGTARKDELIAWTMRAAEWGGAR